jgi:uncharacterized membrane protein
MHEIKDTIIASVSGLPPEIATLVLAMVPVTELRAAIPVGILVFDLSWYSAFLFALIGNIALGMVVLAVGEAGIAFLCRRIDRVATFWHRYVEGIKTKHETKFRVWGAVALITFVAIPLPLTGAFSGAVAASIFRIPYWRGVALLSVGLIIAGSIVTGISLLPTIFS